MYICVYENTHIYVCAHASYQGTQLKIRTLVSIYTHARQEHRDGPHGVPDVKVFVPSACFHLISFPFVSMCVFIICLYFGKAAFHGCPIKCLNLSLSLISLQFVPISISWQTSTRALVSSWAVFGGLGSRRMHGSMMGQKCLMWFRSGECAGQSIVSMPSSSKNRWHTIATWGWVLSCTRKNTGPSGAAQA